MISVGMNATQRKVLIGVVLGAALAVGLIWYVIGQASSYAHREYEGEDY